MLAALGFSLVTGASYSALNTEYRVRVIDDIPVGSTLMDMNDNGVIVGFNNSPLPTHAFYWSKSTGYVDINNDIGTDNVTWANSINNNGIIVGFEWSQLRQDDPDDYRAFVYDIPSKTSQYIPSLPAPYYKCSAYSVNASNQVVGDCTGYGADSSLIGRPFIWSSSAGIKPFVEATASVAPVINDFGVVAGTMNGNTVIWYSPDNAPPTELGIQGQARDINNSGTITGSLSTGRGFYWSVPSGVVDIGDLGAVANSYVISKSINNAGEIVGLALTPSGNKRPFIYTQTSGMLELELPPGYNYGYATAINNNGEIAGYVKPNTSDPQSAAVAVMWTLDLSPIVNAGADQTVTKSQSASLTINGTASDPDGDAMTYRWLYGSTVLGSGTVPSSGTIPLYLGSSSYPVGSNKFTLEVSDGRYTTYDDVVITIINDSVPDTTPPSLTTKTLLINLPPVNLPIPVLITFNASDNDGHDPKITVAISSNEPQSGQGPRDNSPDWTSPVIVGKNIGFFLRAESFLRRGRDYTVAVTATDVTGNKTTVNTVFHVPCSMGRYCK